VVYSSIHVLSVVQANLSVSCFRPHFHAVADASIQLFKFLWYELRRASKHTSCHNNLIDKSPLNFTFVQQLVIADNVKG